MNCAKLLAVAVVRTIGLDDCHPHLFYKHIAIEYIKGINFI